MRPQWQYELAMILVAEGFKDSEVSRRTGIPGRTIRNWRCHYSGRSQLSTGGRRPSPSNVGCVARHGGSVHPPAYAYSRYQFTNNSKDIRALFCKARDDYGVSWRRMNRKNISVARREDVAKLDSATGPKV